MRELLLGPRRFGDLQADLPDIGPNVLSQRLKDLEEAGAVRAPRPARRRPHQPRHVGHGAEDHVRPWAGRGPGRYPRPPTGARGVRGSHRSGTNRRDAGSGP
ncbi:winged helix-turn-helix transcriptional regulator [Deinococcus aetherius]|uniref:winged helix-turn-helix transcriptional regulator n=1 Tax=Deinococcus aetherius TaxID=200252 RepID=UPI0031EDA52D